MARRAGTSLSCASWGRLGAPLLGCLGASAARYRGRGGGGAAAQVCGNQQPGEGTQLPPPWSLTLMAARIRWLYIVSGRLQPAACSGWNSRSACDWCLRRSNSASRQAGLRAPGSGPRRILVEHVATCSGSHHGRRRGMQAGWLGARVGAVWCLAVADRPVADRGPCEMIQVHPHLPANPRRHRTVDVHRMSAASACARTCAGASGERWRSAPRCWRWQLPRESLAHAVSHCRDCNSILARVQWARRARERLASTAAGTAGAAATAHVLNYKS